MENFTPQIIEPSAEEIKKAKSLYDCSMSKARSTINRIKNTHKLAQRWVAYNTITEWDMHYFNKRFKELGATETNDYKNAVHTLNLIKEERARKEKERKMRREEIAAPLKELMQKKVVNKISNYSHTGLMNKLGLNKKMFGETRISHVKYNFNKYLIWGSYKTPLQLVIHFEHLDGWFYKDMGYPLELILDFENTLANPKDKGKAIIKRAIHNTTIATFNKKETEILKEVCENIKKFDQQ